MPLIEHDRASQLVMATDAGLTYEAARKRLETASLHIVIGEALTSVWGQAALIALVACASRMFLRGVYVEIAPDIRCRFPLYANRTLARILTEMGARAEDIPHDACRVQVGAALGGVTATLHCWAQGWDAHVTASPAPVGFPPGNELSGFFAGALAVTTAFRSVVLGDLLARRPQSFSLWKDAPETAIRDVPTSLWLIGLGNLGQANLLALSLLPYRDAGATTLLLQDSDIVGPENIPVQLLTRYSWVGQRKARAAATWAEQLGFRAIATERRFYSGDGPKGEEPRLAIVGVDNLEARRAVAAAGFSLAVDAGLGATGPEAFDLRLHCFPGERTAAQAWPTLAPEPQRQDLPTALQALVDEGKIGRCGAMSIAGKSVGVPATAAAAACLQLTQVVRAIATGIYADRIDLSLRDCQRGVTYLREANLSLPSQPAAD